MREKEKREKCCIFTLSFFCAAFSHFFFLKKLFYSQIFAEFLHWANSQTVSIGVRPTKHNVSTKKAANPNDRTSKLDNCCKLFAAKEALLLLLQQEGAEEEEEEEEEVNGEHAPLEWRSLSSMLF